MPSRGSRSPSPATADGTGPMIERMRGAVDERAEIDIDEVLHRRADRDAGRRTIVAVLAALAVTAAALRISDPERVAWIQTFLVIFGSLLIQALPFVLLGAFAAAAIEVFVPLGTLEKLARLPRPLQLPAAGLAGIAFPICECGSVPVARRLARKGLMPSAAVTFMLAAPVVNPVVIASTFFAYRARSALWTMVDFKLSALYLATFRRGFYRTLVIAVAATTLVGAMWVKVIAG